MAARTGRMSGHSLRGKYALSEDECETAPTDGGVSTVMKYAVTQAMQRVQGSEEKADPKLGFPWKLVPCTFKAG